MSDVKVTHEQALMMLNGHVDETVSVWLTMERPVGDGFERFGIMRMAGELGHVPAVRVSGSAATVLEDALSVTYTIDGKPLALPPLPGTIRAQDLGLEWVLAEGLTLRINWRGGSGVGMSQENVEIVRRLVEAFNDRDDEALVSMLDVEIEFESFTLQTYRGSDGLTEYRRNLDDAWAEWRTEGDRFLSAGSETVVHMHRVVGRGKGSDIPVGQDIAIVWTLRASKVLHGRAFLDPHEALKAVGLEE